MGDTTGNNGRTQNLRPWKPGQSGNPAGRPKGIASQARDLIGDDPAQLLDVFLAIARDDDAKPADRIAAAERYLDRAYGKAPAYAPVEGGDPLERNTVEHEIAGLVDELGARREADAARRATEGSVEAEREAGADTAAG
jgi:hypothetical protein